VQLVVTPEELAPLVERVVHEVIAKLEAQREAAKEKLAFTEEHAAQLLSMETHQLRDERLRGRIGASLIACNRIRYSQADLTAYLNSRRFQPKGAR